MGFWWVNPSSFKTLRTWPSLSDLKNIFPMSSPTIFAFQRLTSNWSCLMSLGVWRRNFSSCLFSGQVRFFSCTLGLPHGFFLDLSAFHPPSLYFPSHTESICTQTSIISHTSLFLIHDFTTIFTDLMRISSSTSWESFLLSERINHIGYMRTVYWFQLCLQGYSKSTFTIINALFAKNRKALHFLCFLVNEKIVCYF